MENTQQESLLEMHLDYDGGHIFHELVRWSRFLSIVGIVVLSICLLAFALAGTALLPAISNLAPGLEKLGGALIIVAVLAVLGAFGFAAYMLYRFSVLTRRGIDQQDQVVFAEGMKCLKIYFVISGILALLGLLSNLYSLTKLFHS